MRFIKQLGRESILVRLAVAMGTIVVLALLSIMVPATFAEMSSGKAGLINLAGSLRMEVYAISMHVVEAREDAAGKQEALEKVIAEFDARLSNPRLLANLPTNAQDPLRRSLVTIEEHWSGSVRPLAREAAVDATRRSAFLAEADRLVAEIDGMVRSIEQQLENRFRMLRVMQAISLFLILIVISITVYLMHVQVLRPITDLLACASAVRRGDFRVSARHTGPDELGQLGEAFNTMVRDLSLMYANLEARVAEKTEELARSNRSLEVLYGTIRTLSEREITNDTLMHVLAEVERVTGVRAGAICACSTEHPQALPLAADMSPSDTRPQICSQTTCTQCIGDGDTRVWRGADGVRIVSIPLVDAGRNYGVMPLQLPAGRELETWQLQLLEAVGRHIGAALAMNQRNEERHRLALFEERSVIARELHDSLAQSLSYLKIQVARLQSLLDKSASVDQTKAVVDELKSGLSNAYRQLRELLTTFRLRIDGRGLHAALEDTVREFSRRGTLTIELRNDLVGIELASNEEIHVLQVIREALSNVEHHAHARHVSIRLRRLADNRINVRVDDDGVGIGELRSPMHHYGLVIMRDRAHSLEGELTVRRRQEGGTRVELEFAPATSFGEVLQPG